MSLGKCMSDVAETAAGDVPVVSSTRLLQKEGQQKQRSGQEDEKH